MADATVTAGRGVLYISLAKFYFMAAGYVIYFTLPRLLGSEVLWGNYLLVVGLVSVINNVIVTATIQSVSKFTAHDDALADGVKRAALKIHLLLGLGLAVLYVVLAPAIAHWERDPGLTPFYRLSAGIMACYAFYAVFVGSLNGLRQFGRQATLDATFATLRGALILSFAAAGWGVAGAVGGFVTAAGIILVAAILWVGLPRRAAPFSGRQVLGFMVQLFIYTFALNLIMRVDLFLLKRFATVLSGEVGVAAQEVSSAFAGYYGTAQTLAFIPYQAILAVAFVVFPLISRTTFESDLATTQAYVRQTLRLTLVFVAGVAVVFMANPEAVLNVVYPLNYRIGGPALRILALGMVFFSMFTIINTILNSAGRPKQTIRVAVVTLALVVLANWYFVPRASSLEAALLAAAAATSSGMAVGVVLAALLLYRVFGAGFPLATVLRIMVAMAGALAVGRFLPEVSKLVTLAECVAVMVTYYLLLALLREFKADDLQRFRRVLSRGQR